MAIHMTNSYIFFKDKSINREVTLRIQFVDYITDLLPSSRINTKAQ